MSWEKRLRKLRSLQRQREFIRCMREMTPEGWDAIRSLPPNERQQLLLRMQKAFEGDLRYKFPTIEVDEFPRVPDR